MIEKHKLVEWWHAQYKFVPYSVEANIHNSLDYHKTFIELNFCLINLRPDK